MSDHRYTAQASAPGLTRRGFLAAAAGALMLGVAPELIGCSDSKNIVVEREEVTDASKQLTFFGFKYEPLNVTAIEDILRDYMDEHEDVSIVYEGIKSRPYFDALVKRLNSGNGDDVFMVDHDTTVAFEKAGYLADLSGLPTIHTFSALALGQMRSGDVITYVPTSISAFGLYCNMKLLKEYGVAVPHTLSEFFDACQTFVDQDIVPIVANNDISLKTVALGRGLASEYADKVAPRRIAAFNENPRGLAAKLRKGFEAVESIVSRGFVNAELTLETEKTSGDLDQFAAGTQPFMLTGAWASVRLHDLAPNLDFEVHPYPVLDDGFALVVNVDTRVSVNANSEYVSDAKDFLAFLTQPASVEHFANSQCSFSPLEGNAAPDDDSLQPLAKAFGVGGAVIGSDDNLRFTIWDDVRQCVVALLQGATAEEAEALLVELLEQEGEAS